MYPRIARFRFLCISHGCHSKIGTNHLGSIFPPRQSQERNESFGDHCVCGPDRARADACTKMIVPKMMFG